MQRNAPAHGNPYCPEFSLSYPHPRQPRMTLSSHANAPTHPEHDLFKMSDKATYSIAAEERSEDRVGHKLTRAVIRCPTSAFNLNQVNTFFLEFLGGKTQLLPRVTISQGDYWIMLGQYEYIFPCHMAMRMKGSLHSQRRSVVSEAKIESVNY